MATTSNNAKPRHIVMVGGGSGGHITPILAVAYQVKKSQPLAVIDYIGQTGDSLGDIPAQDPSIDHAYSVRAGKFRRYYGEGMRQLLDVQTIVKNMRDACYVLVGCVQSLLLLRRLRPDVVFIKGGFVGVPVGLAAAVLQIPYITHDSDAIPGLANRIIGRWARLHAVALPADVYAYPASKTISVGVPVSHEFRLRSEQELRTIRHELGFTSTQPIILVTGGGLGAQRLNNAALAVAEGLLHDYPELRIVHLAGRTQEHIVQKQYADMLTADNARRVQVFGFTTALYKYSAVATVVITRAGGNSIAEFAAQSKACIVVPNPVLTGGHQTKNAKVLSERQAVILVDEATLAREPRALETPVRRVLNEPALAAKLGDKLQTVAKPDSAQRLAMVLLDEQQIK